MTEDRLRRLVAETLLGDGPDIGPMSGDDLHQLAVAVSDANRAIRAAARRIEARRAETPSGSVHESR